MQSVFSSSYMGEATHVPHEQNKNLKLVDL